MRPRKGGKWKYWCEAVHLHFIQMVTSLWDVDHYLENAQNAVHISLYPGISYQFDNNAILIWSDDTCTVQCYYAFKIIFTQKLNFI